MGATVLTTDRPHTAFDSNQAWLKTHLPDIAKALDLPSTAGLHVEWVFHRDRKLNLGR